MAFFIYYIIKKYIIFVIFVIFLFSFIQSCDTITKRKGE